ncbi:pyrroline-5-carboxylate reductase [Silvimonas terrae]|uniref:Pyrroline-5-carboxylate reductase n=1 Tax=Silvimonas terrae TaxID=300266 RepID=A0A840RGG7_9NEIS|nr:pyrroline-5-carboxylate reductase [Silvimonas terrae]MBB5191520.1 pyrroline-5-carboxylate reductase [Silvimonas terrae]
MKITFIGGGNMAGAMIGGLISQGFAASDLFVVEPDQGRRNQLAQEYGLATGAPDQPLPASDVVIFAVKPQQLRQVAQTAAPQLAGALALSIAAGVRVDTLSRWLGGYARVVRVMPNTPALVQAGISGVFAAEGVSAEDRAAVDRILASIGKVVWLKDESEMDGITAISGSGPAYVFYFIESLQAAARAQGFAPDIARELAYETVAGAMKLAAQSDDDAATLRIKVTSKGGTTERAINAMDNSQVRATIIAATQAAAARSRELGDELGRDTEA